MASHSWEHRRLWNHENVDDDDFRCGECSDSNNDADAEATTPGMEFVNFMLTLLFQSAISASTWCVVMWFAGRAGITEAKKYGLKPGSPTGHYMRKVKGILGWNNKNIFYEMNVPGHAKHDLERTVQIVQVIPGHEQMFEAMKGNETDVIELRARLDREDGLPPCYYNHPIVQGAPADVIVWPVAIYLDGVPYSHTDGVIGFWLINMITGRRFLYAVLRKRIICQCGCRGWCTFWHFFQMTKWMLRSLSRGTFPTERHDSMPFRDTDQYRINLAGSNIGFRCACLYMKGDWMEFAATVGLAPWQDALRPCYECTSYGSDMFETAGISMDAMRWHLNDDESYFVACERCEHVVELRRKADVNAISGLLRYDKRTDGFKGRCLTRDITLNGTVLKANDRLEPSDTLTDIGAFGDISDFPTRVVFWRSSDESMTRHRNPFFDPDFGITPRRTLTVDVLHAFFLGVLNTWSKITIWELICCGAYGHMGSSYENFAASVLVLRDRLMRFYVTHHSDRPTDQITRVADFTVKMMGSKKKKKLKTKGAETWGMALFLISELRLRVPMLESNGVNGNRLLHAGEMLEKIVRIWKAHDWTMPRAAAKDNSHAHIPLCLFGCCVICLFVRFWLHGNLFLFVCSIFGCTYHTFAYKILLNILLII